MRSEAVVCGNGGSYVRHGQRRHVQEVRARGHRNVTGGLEWIRRCGGTGEEGLHSSETIGVWTFFMLRKSVEFLLLWTLNVIDPAAVKQGHGNSPHHSPARNIPPAWHIFKPIGNATKDEYLMGARINVDKHTHQASFPQLGVGLITSCDWG
ncbi:hypothetical protein THAOC_08381 [Thalassiosira oceanica]|uniref:Uncharacterized protein n=1 Tax=Thalassiosira oceanica TaxID=159749 RepID=K0SV67_THAOC|nr:hypothetical protein THAOC_08381 [Thalassiosira oceanica]|eukprot:EJK70273.1 hypothetical protein THAOC_08381 [Thalassiosira oceanica]